MKTMKTIKTLEEAKYLFGFKFNDNLQALFAAYAVYVAHVEIPQLYKAVDVNAFVADRSCGHIVYDEQSTAFVSTRGGWSIFAFDLLNILNEAKKTEPVEKEKEDEDEND